MSIERCQYRLSVSGLDYCIHTSLKLQSRAEGAPSGCEGNLVRAVHACCRHHAGKYPAWLR